MFLKRLLATAVAVTVFLGISGLNSPSRVISAEPVTVPVTVTITKFVEIEDPDPAPFQGRGDYYAVVTIGSETFSNVDHFIQGPGDDFVGEYEITPNWEFTANVNPCLDNGTVKIDVRIFDKDPLPPDDVMDISPDDGFIAQIIRRNVFRMDTRLVVQEGDGDTEHSGLFEGGEVGRVEYSVSGGFVDSDGDGLPDVWEEFGADVNCDGIVDIDLPGMGADPNHKDLFVEIDWQSANPPTRAGVQAVKEAFAKAPINAGGIPNPDELPGINLWIDTGGLMEGGELVGDDLGGGNNLLVSGQRFCTFDNDFDEDGKADFYQFKDLNFAPERAMVFRYAISGMFCSDREKKSGGWAEFGGNDMIILNSAHNWGGTFMHELGHNLRLEHGGSDQNACKPNYVSIMSYSYSGGIRWVDYGQLGGGETHLDFSPPRFRDISGVEARLTLPLPELKEDNLNETTVLSGNPILEFVYTNARGHRVRQPLDRGPDWDGDGHRTATDLTVNIDDDGTNGPKACNNDKTDSLLKGHDDWSNIVLPFQHFGDSVDGPVNLPHDETDPTNEEIAAFEVALTTTDLSIQIGAAPSPAVAGEDLVYTYTVTNHGPNTALEALVTSAIPAGSTFVSASPGCDVDGAATLTCTISELQADQAAAFDLTVRIDPNYVVDAPSVPIAISNGATVANIGSTDSELDNNSANNVTTVIANVDLRIEKDADLDPAVAGENLVYTIYVTNAGPSTAGGVSVTDILPDGASFFTASAGCSEFDGTVTCELGELTPDQQKSVDIEVLVDAGLVHSAGRPTTITNNAGTQSLIGIETDASDNTTSLVTDVIASSDLAIVSAIFVSPPSEILLGANVQVTLRRTITNLGPSTPADAYVSFKVTSDIGSTIAPAEGLRTEIALDGQRVINDVLTIACSQPGPHTYTVDSEITSTHGDEDRYPANNTARTVLVVACVVPVVLNVQPGGEPNSVLNVSRGNIPAAVMTTYLGEYGLPYAFDAATIELATVRFGPRGLVRLGDGASPINDSGKLEDVIEPGTRRTRDGDLDMIMQFPASKTSLAKGDTEACIYGSWKGPADESFRFFGCTSIRTER